MTQPTTNYESQDWRDARRRVANRRDFGSHVVVFVVVNACMVAIWAFTGSGYFWPAWLIGVWAVGLVLHGWDAFFKRPVTDADVEAELERSHRG